MTGLPGRRLRWTAVTGKGPGGLAHSQHTGCPGRRCGDVGPCPFGLQKCRLDDACTCLYLSDAFLRMVGYTRQEIRELFEDSFYRLLPPDDAARVRRSINEALDAGESSLELEYRLQTKDGGIYGAGQDGGLGRTGPLTRIVSLGTPRSILSNPIMKTS